MLIPLFHYEKKDGQIYNWWFEWLGRSFYFHRNKHFHYKGHPFCYTYPDRKDRRFVKELWFGAYSKWGTGKL